MNSKSIYILIHILVAGFNLELVAVDVDEKIININNKLNLNEQNLVFDVGANTRLELRYVPTGSFKYSAPNKETGIINVKQHSKYIRINNKFWMGKYEITRRQMLVVFDRFEPENEDYDQLDRPVSFVSHSEANYFCKILTKRILDAGILDNIYEFRLPTEVEWEYACLAGKDKIFGVGDGDNLDSSLANFNGIYPHGKTVVGPTLGKTVSVGRYKGNDLGIHDMHGNVWEWCLDGFSDSKLNDRAANSSENIIATVIRGGSWTSSGRFCMAYSRIICLPTLKRPNLGFRIILSRTLQK